MKATKDTDTRGNPCWRIDSDSVSLVAVLTYATEAERDADARTAHAMAAAPELLGIALRTAQHFEGTDSPLGIAAREAIRKATAPSR